MVQFHFHQVYVSHLTEETGQHLENTVTVTVNVYLINNLNLNLFKYSREILVKLMRDSS